MLSFISSESLKELVEANAVRDAKVIAERNVFKVTVKYGTSERLVSVRDRTGRAKERVFTSLDSVAKFMRDRVHLVHYQVDASNFDPGATTRKRPDAASRLKDAHAALSHADWVNQKVASARAGLADGTNQRFDATAWEAIRAEKKAQRQARAA